MKTMLSKIFGPNWRSSSSGIATVVAVTTSLAIHSDPTLVAFLPDIAEVYITGIAKLVAVVSGIIFALTVKDAAVTGETVAQTSEVKDITHGENI
jgi:hypothetical protein